MKRVLSPSPQPDRSKKSKKISVTDLPSPSDDSRSQAHGVDGRKRRDTPAQLQMSILRWVGTPDILSPEDGPSHDETGIYESAVPDSSLVLKLRSWNARSNQAEYVPANGPVTFEYERHARVGYLSDGCGIVGDNMPAKVQVCRLGENPWPQVLLSRTVMVAADLLST